MNDQPAPVQTIALRADGADTQAFFAVVTQGDLQRALAAPQVFLNQTELAHWQTLRVEHKRQSALQGRIAAKRALGAALGEVDFTKIEIARGTFGQPLVRHARAGGLEVTLSHAQGLAVALAYPAALPMGIDLEQVAAASAQTVLNELQLSGAEGLWLEHKGVVQAGAQALVPLVQEGAAPSRIDEATACGLVPFVRVGAVPSRIDEATACGMLWSAREALGKSLKTGLNSPLGVFALDKLEPAEAATGMPPGTLRWAGYYLNFPRTQCLLQVSGSQVLALALPRAVTLAAWPQMPLTA